jgi:putative ABC transport system permease protein
MLKNYLIVSLRNLNKSRIFTIINILGLGIALSVCIIAFFNHMFNYEYDRTHENFQKIYRITSFSNLEGRELEYGIVPATLGLEIKKDIPGIEKSARFARATYPVKKGDDIIKLRTSYIDPEFLEIFTFPMVIGDSKSIENRANVLISKTTAGILFGSEYPVGKSLSIICDGNKEFTYTVGAVFEDLPMNSSFRINILSHIDNLLFMRQQKDTDWKIDITALFIQVPDKTRLPSISQSLKNYLPVQNKAREDFKINRFNLTPLKEVAARSREISSSNLAGSLHPAAVVTPSIMALLILLIACFNFANTSIAGCSKRLKEIGLRKTFGGQKSQLVTQFMLEAIIVCFMALLVGIALGGILVPAYSSLWSNMSLTLTFTEYPFFWIFLFLLLLFTGFIAGVYPAMYVSSFSPVNVIKGASSFKGAGKLSSLLLALQFSISIMALAMGLIFAKNSQFQETLDLGYDKDKLIVLPLPSEYYTSFRNDILTNPKIISAEGTQNHIGFGGYRRPVKSEEKKLDVDVLDIGPSYPSTMGLRLVEGRNFEELRTAADRANNSIIVNRKLVKDFDWKEAVGHTITVDDTIKFNVIGVVEDFYTNGVWQVIEPTILRLSASDKYDIMAVRANEEDLPAVLEYLNAKWKSKGTNFIFGGMLQEDTMQDEKDINSNIIKINVFNAIIAILLSLIGMYNLVSLDIFKRTKEMGIRKIQGASVALIMFLVSKKFLIVLLVASVLGCTGGYYMSVMLMDSIWDYFVEVKIGILLLSALIMVGATLLTIVFKIFRAAMMNPVVSLRYE